MNRPRTVVAWMTLLGILAWISLPSRAQSADEKKPAAEKPKSEDKKPIGSSLEGKPAPNIDLAAFGLNKIMPNDNEVGTHLVLSNLRDKNVVVLIFFPNAKNDDNSAVECGGFRDLLSQFEQNNVVVVGISNRSLSQQKHFSKKEKLNFPLYGDEMSVTCGDYGVLDKNGRVNRVTFVIDKKGIVRKAFEVKDAKKHPQEVLDYVKSLKS